MGGRRAKKGQRVAASPASAPRPPPARPGGAEPFPRGGSRGRRGPASSSATRGQLREGLKSRSPVCGLLPAPASRSLRREWGKKAAGKQRRVFIFITCLYFYQNSTAFFLWFYSELCAARTCGFLLTGPCLGHLRPRARWSQPACQYLPAVPRPWTLPRVHSSHEYLLRAWRRALHGDTRPGRGVLPP